MVGGNLISWTALKVAGMEERDASSSSTWLAW